MPNFTYESLPSSVLAWKKNNKLGRFDPSAPEKEQKKVQDGWDEVEKRGRPCFSSKDHIHALSSPIARLYFYPVSYPA